MINMSNEKEDVLYYCFNDIFEVFLNMGNYVVA